jgi:hypothetical protein
MRGLGGSRLTFPARNETHQPQTDCHHRVDLGFGDRRDGKTGIDRSRVVEETPVVSTNREIDLVMQSQVRLRVKLWLLPRVRLWL